MPTERQPASLTLAQKIERSATWHELVELFYPSRGFDIQRRNASAPSNLYQDAVLCNLYDALHEEERAAYLRVIINEIKKYSLDLPRGSIVSEVGCGPGLILIGLATDLDIRAREHQFAGFDRSPEMIRIANERAGASSAKKSLSFQVATNCSAEATAVLARSSFVIYRNVLSWLDDPMEEFLLWKRSLRPSARVYLREIRRDIPFEHFKRRVLECMAFKFEGARLTFPPECMVTAYLRALTPQEVETALLNTGLVCKRELAKSGVVADNGETPAAEMVFIVERKA